MRRGQSGENDEPKQTLMAAKGWWPQGSLSSQPRGVRRWGGMRTRGHRLTAWSPRGEAGQKSSGQHRSYLGAGVVGRLAALTLARAALGVRVGSGAALRVTG